MCRRDRRAFAALPGIADDVANTRGLRQQRVDPGIETSHRTGRARLQARAQGQRVAHTHEHRRRCRRRPQPVVGRDRVGVGQAVGRDVEVEQRAASTRGQRATDHELVAGARRGDVHPATSFGLGSLVLGVFQRVPAGGHQRADLHNDRAREVVDDEVELIGAARRMHHTHHRRFETLGLEQGGDADGVAVVVDAVDVLVAFS